VKHPRDRLRAYCALLAEEGAPTAVRDAGAAWEVHVADALAAVPVVRELARAGTEAVDVGSGGGSPGIPLAVELGIPVLLLDASARRCRFLERAAAAADAPCTVLAARSEEYGRGAGRDAHGLAFARALAPPPVALELVLPLVAPGGHAVLWTGRLDPGPLAPVAAELGAVISGVHTVSDARLLVVARKDAPTPQRYPRRPGMARKRPLARLASPA
jgi:16S rRNA (guanine527-N7)-methyltransferase